MNNIYKFLIFIVFATVILLSCDKAFKVESLTVYPSVLSAEVNDTTQLSFSLQYSGGKFEAPDLISPEWKSSNEDVVEVNKFGRIVSKSVGEAKVSVICGGISATCDVTVVDNADSDNN